MWTNNAEWIISQTWVGLVRKYVNDVGTSKKNTHPNIIQQNCLINNSLQKE